MSLWIFFSMYPFNQTSTKQWFRNVCSVPECYWVICVTHRCSGVLELFELANYLPKITFSKIVHEDVACIAENGIKIESAIEKQFNWQQQCP